MLIDEQLANWSASPHFSTPPVFIYGLIDPRTFECRYIGKSIRPKERLSNHMQDQSACHRTRWLQELKAIGLRPDLLVIEIVEGSHPWQVSEKAWIAYGRAQGWPLTNGTIGGDGVDGLSAESLDRMRRTWIGRKHTDAAKKKIGDRKRGSIISEAVRERMRQVHTGRVITWGAKISKAIQSVTDDQARDIIRRLEAGERNIDLAREFGVHRTTISNIKMKKYGWGSL